MRPWEEAGRTAIERARALVAAADGGRGQVKQLAAWLDAKGDEALRAAIVQVGRERGAELPDEAAAWPAKRLLRLARGLEDEAQTRRNPIRRDEAFTCAHCGAEVPAHGRTARDHCPRCLRSLHVDAVPGDRAAGCGGVLDPVSISLVAGKPVIHYRCRACGAEKVNQALLDGDPPDDWALISALSAGERA